MVVSRGCGAGDEVADWAVGVVGGARHGVGRGDVEGVVGRGWEVGDEVCDGVGGVEVRWGGEGGEGFAGSEREGGG